MGREAGFKDLSVDLGCVTQSLGALIWKSNLESIGPSWGSCGDNMRVRVGAEGRQEIPEKQSF